MSKRLKTAIELGNDVNLGVLGECWLGAGKKAANIVGIFPGTGVGGGIIIHGEFLTGAQGAAAEIGHMQIDPNGPLCTCGNTGCLEASAGRWAIERDICAALKSGEKSLITKIAGNNIQQIKSSMLAKALTAKDPLVTRIMTQAANAIGRACVSLNHIFNPDMFLFGGGVIEACGDMILNTAEKALKNDPFFKQLKTPRVVASKLGDDATMLGAAAMAIKKTHTLGKISLYPTLRLSPSKKPLVKGKVISKTSFLRADGKLKEPKETLSGKIGQNEIEDLIRKSPDVLWIAARSPKTITLTPKANGVLKKKKIACAILPTAKALAAYNASTDRKAILFYL
ncbi:MAG: ROK family protein [Candidatus Omnitrophica bacterium]|nr:ROK family protein [Candidatus Omnitrophota bacterium]